MRVIFSSTDIKKQMDKKGLKKAQIVSVYPICRADCPCQPEINRLRKHYAEMPEKKRQAEYTRLGKIDCTRDKTGMTMQELVCADCGEVQGYVWAKDASLSDWCDFHYAQWTDGQRWRGCLTPNVSPIDGKLCLECCCGADTRDFRANNKLSKRALDFIEEKNKIGRLFDELDSKFKTTKVKLNKVIKTNFSIY